MKEKTKTKRIIIIGVILIVLVIAISIGITYAFMKPINDTESITEVSLSSCAKITLTDTSSIDLSNTYPMSRNRALQTTPYTFTVTSSCDTYVGFNLYLGVLASNTLDASNIHYIVTETGTTTILSEGTLTSDIEVTSDFSDSEIAEYNTGTGGDISAIYDLYSGSIPYLGSVTYDLYLYVDSEVEIDTQGLTFSAGVAVKSYEREEDTLADLCSGLSLSDCIINYVYTSDGENNLYYFDGSGTYTNAEYEADELSYRYSGASDEVENYVCFGSEDETCPTDSLYRIIGVFQNDDEVYEVKLIKYDYATSDLLGEDGDYYTDYSSYGDSTSYYIGNNSTSTIGTYYWNNINYLESYGNSKYFNDWSYSELNTVNLNSNYLKNIESTWSNLIVIHTWIVGGNDDASIHGYNSTPGALTAYTAEITSPVTTQVTSTYDAKVGLMYVSDYAYAADPTYWSTKTSNYHSEAYQYDWMYMGLNEWTITRQSYEDTNYYDSVTTSSSYIVFDNGEIATGLVVYSSLAVRPVFYLNSSVEYSSGTGTSSDPIRLSVN